ncbi:MAG: hypothetical protein WC389_12820 [Lutibacter sp.]
MQVYQGSDGSQTRGLYKELEKHGAIGIIAMNLFRAQKCSTRTKKYHGGISGLGSYRDLAYDRKQYSMDELCKALKENAEKLNIKWGWKVDPKQEYHKHCLYVTLPQGQVSFHSDKRGIGEDFQGDWDGKNASEIRIIKFVDSVLSGN